MKTLLTCAFFVCKNWLFIGNFVLAARRVTLRKGQAMKNTIRISYEDRKNPIYFEISESEYQIMVDADVENRTKNAIANGESENYVAPPRSVQQILDEEINRPTYNINQKETRRHCLLSSVDPNNKYICDNHDFVDDLLAKENIEELYQAIDRLQPQQKELLYQNCSH